MVRATTAGTGGPRKPTAAHSHGPTTGGPLTITWGRTRPAGHLGACAPRAAVSGAGPTPVLLHAVGPGHRCVLPLAERLTDRHRAGAAATARSPEGHP